MCICPIVNVIAWLELETAYFQVKPFNHYTTETEPFNHYTYSDRDKIVNFMIIECSKLV